MTVSEDTTEFWVRNARLYMGEALECDQLSYVWDVSFVMRHRSDIRDLDKYMSLKLRGRQWQYILVGLNEASLHDSDHPRENPLAVWPVWDSQRHTIEQLENWMINPVGKNRALCQDESVTKHVRPVWGQEERIILNTGNLNKPTPRRSAHAANELQQEYPNVKIHLHESGSFRFGFGLSFGAFDFECRSLAMMGHVTLPNGKQIYKPDFPVSEDWIRLMGFTPRQLEVPRNRVLFNIRSGQWASENYKQNIKWKTRGFEYSKPGKHAGKRVWFKNQKPVETDMLACYKCTMQLACKFYRDGSVCSVPGSEGQDLSSMFKTRDADVIVDALSDLLAKNAVRLENAMDNEADKGVVDPHVTKMIESIWDRGERLAKLLNPELGQPMKTPSNLNFLNVNVAKSPQELAAAVMAELEARGVSRDQVTPELVENLMAMTAEEKKKAINVLAVGSGSS